MSENKTNYTFRIISWCKRLLRLNDRHNDIQLGLGYMWMTIGPIRLARFDSKTYFSSFIDTHQEFQFKFIVMLKDIKKIR